MLPFNAVYSYLKQLQIPTEVEPLCPTTVPTEYQSFHTKLSLLSEVKKHDTPSTALQQLALVTINERYPPEEYLRIYTDESLLKIDRKAGAGIHSELFSHYSSVGSNRTSIDGEITAIAMANSKRSKKNNKTPQQTEEDSCLSVGPLTRRNTRQ